MSSQRKLVSVIAKDSSRGTPGREREVPLIEIDSTFAKLLGFTDGQKVQSHTRHECIGTD